MEIRKKVFKATPAISDKVGIGIVPVTAGVDEIQDQVNEIEEELDGGLTPSNVAEYRNTYVFNENGNLDATHDLIVEFELIDEMTKLVECKVTFKTKNYRTATAVPREL